jgi:glycerol kinase
LQARDIACLGITNQRETTLVWNRRTGKPVHNAIVWQDRRTESICAALRERGLEDQVTQKTGLRLDAYFSGTKLKWILDHVQGARAAAQRGELAFGTVDTWLLWQLTNGAVHATDVSNASRTLLFNVHDNRWDEALLSWLDIEPSLLPQVYPSSHTYGCSHAQHLGAEVAIGGMAKNTYGTGCFMLMQTGSEFQRSAHGLITTSAAQTSAVPEFALEGSVFNGGAVVQWLRDGLGVISHSSEVQALAESVPDSAGVMFVPAFSALGAPYWQPDARGAILGLTRGSNSAHIARAALESIAFQSAALLRAMTADAVAAGASAVTELRVDGGACVNNFLMQFQADLLGIPVVRPRVTETTALGAAYLAGLSCGLYKNLDELTQLWRSERVFHPSWPEERAAEWMCRWDHAVAQTTLNPT